MTYVPPPIARKGQRLRADRLNYDEAGIRSARIVSGEGVLVSRGSTGSSIALDPLIAPATTFWIRLIASDSNGHYSWHQIVAAPTTADPYAWSDATGGNVSGTQTSDPAIEANGCTTLAAGTRVEVRRERATGQIRFQLETC